MTLREEAGMTRERHTTWLVALAILVAAAVLALRSCDTPNARRIGGLGASSAEQGRGDGTFTVAGDVTQPIAPGIDVPIVLRFTNPYDFDFAASHLVVSVSSVETRVADLSQTCTVDDFAVVQLSPQATVTIPSHDSTTVGSIGGSGAGRPTISLIDRAVNQDGCKDATVRLRYSAQGRRHG